jgi:ribosomal protein S18 acetylase RimI-like enzyme
VLDLSIAAWEPVFHSFRQVLGPAIYPLLYPDWEKSQREDVTQVCHDGEKYSIWVATEDEVVAGFVAYELNAETKTGEVYMVAVHPTYQRQGIGAALNTLALDKLKKAGMTLAVVGTDGDPGHAPARRSYAKAGYTPLPLVRYYKALT